jgi:16S rRNA (guanine527-N7)-methyltransferase
MESILTSGLKDLGLSPAPAQVLSRYGEALLEQNQVMNLTAISEPSQVARLHMLDCAGVLGAADFSGKKVLDVGTGAGFPGLVLKLCEPSMELTLLDSLGKRVSWLESLAPQLGAEGVVCVHGRAEELSPLSEWREQFDIVTSRAVADLRMLCELCLPFVKVGGVFLAMKAEDSQEEVNAAGRAVSILGGRLLSASSYAVPGTDVVRKVIRVEKIKPTPQRYPRRFSKIKKSPL